MNAGKKFLSCQLRDSEERPDIKIELQHNKTYKQYKNYILQFITSWKQKIKLKESMHNFSFIGNRSRSGSSNNIEDNKNPEMKTRINVKWKNDSVDEIWKAKEKETYIW